MAENPKPLVSISCITYNHAPYIRECLEGFLMQKTNFPFEILIHDDASTDGTADIIREYQAKHPDLIKPILREKNLYSQGVRMMNRFNYERARGKYIALCEGDDYWTDPHKLQIQFNFMESHPDYSMCLHGRYMLDNIKKCFYRQRLHKMTSEDGKYYAKGICEGYSHHATQTVFLRKSLYDEKREAIYRDTCSAPMGDMQLMFHMGLAGNVKVMRRYMAVYRITSTSVSNYSNNTAYQKFLADGKYFIKKMLDNSNGDYLSEKKEKCTQNGVICVFRIIIHWILFHTLFKINYILFILKNK